MRLSESEIGERKRATLNLVQGSCFWQMVNFGQPGTDSILVSVLPH